MAVTKILNIGAGKQGNMAAHLQNALAYIANADKTENGLLVGYINCMEGMVFEQMCRTKQLYGKASGRQGYHFVLSLVPGEGTSRQMFEIVREFAEEFLQGEYEAVYSVHTDKNHIHAHLVFNSVNLETGRKYDYRKGDWKHKIQPITNRLCGKHGLSIMPAEYSKDPVNMNRKQWEKEQKWSEVIAKDVRYVLGRSGGFEDFLYLMESLGYKIKRGKHLAVKAKEMRRFRRLDTIDAEYTEENIRKGLAEGHWGFELPEVVAPHPEYFIKPKNEYQKKYYDWFICFAYSEQQRFYRQNRHQSEVEKMHRMNEQYLYLCRHEIDGIDGILKEAEYLDSRWEHLGRDQQHLYRERAERKRKCKTEEDVLKFLVWEADYRKKLEEIKREKKEIRYQKNLGKQCIVESIAQSTVLKETAMREQKKMGNPYDLDIPVLPSECRRRGEDLQKAKKGQVQKESREVPQEEQVAEEMSGDSIADIQKVAEFLSSEDYSASMPQAEVKEYDKPAARENLLHILEEESLMEEECLRAKMEEIHSENRMTKERYETLTDVEKAEWIEIDLEDVFGSMKKFCDRMEDLGIRFDSIGDSTDEYLRLQQVVEKERKANVGYGYYEERGRGR